MTLYAQWTANPTYTVTYNGNGSTGGTVPTDSNPYAQNATVTVLGNTGSLEKTGNTFTGWNTAADGTGAPYVANATFSMGAANVTLYAQWTVSPWWR
ncbi:InlB B-repeat-containing protein [Paenibacillus rhizoplanae]